MNHADPAKIPLQNRVLPTGEIVAHPARGLFMGNRGRIHRPDRTLGRRRWSTTTWIACVLCFRGRQRRVWGDSYTELFFHDEAVALSAGHRPCAECRRADYRRFQAAWRIAHGEDPTAPTMNARLHADRTGPRHTARLAELPHGSFVLLPSGPALIANGVLHPFTPSGYGPPCTAPAAATVLTPRCTLAVLHAGYRPMLRV